MQALNHQELAWAAGFFDGEGSTSYSNKKTLPCIAIGQADPFVLERFRAAVGGVGCVFGPYKRRKNPTWKDQWNYHAGKFEEVQAIIAVLWKWLSPLKREQASKVLLAYKAICREKPDMRRGQLLCKRGHDLSDAAAIGHKANGSGRFCKICSQLHWKKRGTRA